MTLIPELRSSVPDVGITAVSPSHDIKLSDENGNSVGLIFCDRNGRRNPLGVNSGYMPRSPMRISTGSTGYSDQEPPFITEVQSTWVGGRAQADLSTDRTRFADSYRIDTTKQYPICANGAAYTTGTAGNSDFAKKAAACKYPAVSTANVVIGFTLQINPGLGVSSCDIYYEAIVATQAPDYANYDEPGDYAYSYHVTNPSYYDSLYLGIEPLTVPANANLWLIVYADYPDETPEWIAIGLLLKTNIVFMVGFIIKKNATRYSLNTASKCTLL